MIEHDKCSVDAAITPPKTRRQKDETPEKSQNRADHCSLECATILVHLPNRRVGRPGRSCARREPKTGHKPQQVRQNRCAPKHTGGKSYHGTSCALLLRELPDASRSRRNWCGAAIDAH